MLTGVDMWRLGDRGEANALLAEHHYLGPLKSGGKVIVIGETQGTPVAAMIWKHPTSRRLPSDGSWLELSRWCLTPAAGESAGSRMHRATVRLLREELPQVTTLVSYSDPSAGHTGALYRACNWIWAPTWHRLRPPPTGQGDWGGASAQAVKDRWVFPVQKRKSDWEQRCFIDDAPAIRKWAANHPPHEETWARSHPQLRDPLGCDPRGANGPRRKEPQSG